MLNPSVAERALPWHVTVNTGRLHGNTAIWQKGMRYGTNEADNSLNNDIVSLMCYQRNEERV